MRLRQGIKLAVTCAASFIGALCCSQALAGEIRLAAYNLDADVSSFTPNTSARDALLQGIGNFSVVGHAQQLDILAMEETTSNSTTVTPIVNDLNGIYGAGTYATPSFQATENGNDPTFGNGPNAILYNTKTLTLLGAVGVGTPQGATNGEYRQVARYEFQPIGGAANSIFYVYVSHMKSSASGSLSADQAARNGEAAIIRNDETNLSAAANVLYVGDFNMDGTAEPAYATLTGSGQGQAFDPLNTTNASQNWSLNNTFKGILTESVTNLRFRDDLLLMTQNVLNDTSGFQYVSGSYTAFGNNGSISEGGSLGSSSNTALNSLSNGSTLRSDLSLSSDHIPVFADFAFTAAVVPEPTSATALLICGLLCFRRNSRKAI